MRLEKDSKQWQSLSTMKGYDIYMLVIATFGKIFLVFQIIRIILNQSSTNVSLMAHVTYFIGILSWLVYGYLSKNTIVTVSSVFGLVLVTILLILIILYAESGIVWF